MMAAESISPEEFDRYREQIRLPDIGRVGQLRMNQAGVAIVGLGGSLARSCNNAHPFGF